MQLIGSDRKKIVVFEKGAIIVGRDGRVNVEGFGAPGIQKVIFGSEYFFGDSYTSEIEAGDTILISLVSTHDILNLVRFRDDIKRASRVIVGGPACHNIRAYKHLITDANFGRCDNAKIDRIIDGTLNSDEKNTVWDSSDLSIKNQYFVDTNIALGRSEHAAGCKLKCTFCFYSYWNGFKTKTETKHYTSGFAPYEDFWKTLDWDKARRGAVTALDGFNEETRKRILKPNTLSRLYEKLLEADSVETEHALRLKVYLIAGYPWEDNSVFETLDLIEACKMADEKLLKNKVIIKLHCSHFIPFPKTPLWDSAFNDKVNIRNWSIENPVLFRGKNITLYSPNSYGQSPSGAAVSTAIMRATEDDFDILCEFSTRKFQNLQSDKKLERTYKIAGHLLARQSADPCGFVTTPNDNLSEKIRARQ